MSLPPFTLLLYQLPRAQSQGLSLQHLDHLTKARYP